MTSLLLRYISKQELILLGTQQAVQPEHLPCSFEATLQPRDGFEHRGILPLSIALGGDSAEDTLITDK